MQHRSSSVDVSLEEGSHRDTGVLELVADLDTGQRGFRRIFPAAMNQVQPDPDYSVTGGAESVRRRPSLAIRTQSPIHRQETTSTVHSMTPKPRMNVMRALRNSFRGKHDEVGLTGAVGSGLPYANGSINALGNAWKGKEKDVTGLFQDNEGDKLSVVMDDARLHRLAMKARDIREWVKGRSMHRTPNDNPNGNTNPNTTTNNTTKPTPNTGGRVRDLFKGRHQNISTKSSVPVSIPTPASVPIPAPAPARKDRGPRPGQTYEIYEHRVIENNPERTVEISTWREQVPVKKIPSDQEDKISIYYITADDYPEEDRPMAKVEWRTEGGDMPPSRTDYSLSGSANRLGTHGHTRPTHSRHGSHYSTRPSDPRRHHSHNGHVSDNSTAKKGTSTRDDPLKPSVKRHHPHPNTASHTGTGANHAASQISPARTREGTISPSSSERGVSSTPTEKKPTPQLAQPQNSGSKFVEHITNGSLLPSSPSIPAPATATSPPLTDPPPHTSPPTVPPRTLRHTRRELFPGESTPIAGVSPTIPGSTTRLNGPTSSSIIAGNHAHITNTSSPPPVITSPFNATRDSGSTISSIKSVAAVQLEAILQSCEPSLLHIAPELRKLGIRHIEHLRAVGKLTPATRDREVREGALKLGITVVEWAILLDRIFTLL